MLRGTVLCYDSILQLTLKGTDSLLWGACLMQKTLTTHICPQDPDSPLEKILEVLIPSSYSSLPHEVLIISLRRLNIRGAVPLLRGAWVQRRLYLRGTSRPPYETPLVSRSSFPPQDASWGPVLSLRCPLSLRTWSHLGTPSLEILITSSRSPLRSWFPPQGVHLPISLESPVSLFETDVRLAPHFEIHSSRTRTHAPGRT